MMTSLLRRGLHARSLALMLILIGVLAGVQATALAPSAHAASCYQGGCDGQDPQIRGCDTDAQNVDSFAYQGSNADLSGTLLELRYSPTCDAAWVRSTGGSCSPSNCGVAIEASRGDPNNIDHYMLGAAAGGVSWTNMINYRFYVRGCFENFGLELPNGYTYEGCTGWH